MLAAKQWWLCIGRLTSWSAMVTYDSDPKPRFPNTFVPVWLI